MWNQWLDWVWPPQETDEKEDEPPPSPPKNNKRVLDDAVRLTPKKEKREKKQRKLRDETIGTQHMCNMGKAKIRVCGAELTVRYGRKKATCYALLDEGEIARALSEERGARLLDLATDNPELFWNLAYVCQRRVSVMEKMLVKK